MTEYAADLAQGVQFMHENHVAHRFVLPSPPHFAVLIPPQGLHVGKHHARPVKHVSQLVPPR